MSRVKRPLTRSALDKATCQAHECTHENHEGVVLHGRCHLESSTTVRYWASGVIEIRCKRCDKGIAEVLLHPDEQVAMAVALVCKDPLCKELPENHSLVLRAQCHRGAGLFVVYQCGHLLVTCGVCKARVSSHHVAGDGASA